MTYQGFVGRLYLVTTAGQLTVIHTFSGSGGDVDGPKIAPGPGAGGWLYRTTELGGAYGQGSCSASTPDRAAAPPAFPPFAP